MSGLLIGCGPCIQAGCACNGDQHEHCPWCDSWGCRCCDPGWHERRAPYCVNRRQGPSEKWLREAAG